MLVVWLAAHNHMTHCYHRPVDAFGSIPFGSEQCCRGGNMAGGPQAPMKVDMFGATPFADCDAFGAQPFTSTTVQ